MAIADVELFRVGVVIKGIHQTADFPALELRDRRKRIWKRIDAIPETAEALAGVRHYVRLSRIARRSGPARSDRQHGREQRGIELLQHEQRDVQKCLPIIDAGATANQVLAFAREIVSEAD